jgi:glycosyltransferase involved in cell wall biosynthesis
LRLLILNGDLPVFPGRAGHEHLHTMWLARLAQRAGLVSMVHTVEQDEKTQGLLEAGVDLYLWKNPGLRTSPAAAVARPTRLRRAGEVLYHTARNWRRHPFDAVVQDLRFRNIAGPFLQALSEERWQALVVVQSICARWLDYLPRAPVSVLVIHDIRALVYERRAATARSLRERLTRSWESRCYRRFEREYCARYDLVITVSRADEAWVRTHYRPRRLTTIPIPVDGGYFAPMPGIRERPAQILFTGMMAHPPNVDAACFFARKVFPLVRAIVPEAEFWIVGRDPTAQVRALATLPGVVVTGSVPDIRIYIAQATVVVVPVRFGSGMRNKILEAWAMQKCIVSTRIGAEGLDGQDGVNILLADDAQALATRVVEAIRDSGLRDRIRLPGRALVLTSHDPETLARRYYEAVGSVLRETSRPDRPLRVVIDLRSMRPGVAGGIERSSRLFLECLVRLDRVNRYAVLAPAEVRDDLVRLGHSNVTFASDRLGGRWRTAALAAARSLHRWCGAQYWRTPEVEILRRARAFGAEVALSVSGFIHPDVAPLTNVLIVPDIQHECCPKFFSRHDLEERRRLYSASAQRASHICAVSEFTRQTLIERLHIPPARITTTHLAADPLFHPGSPARRDVRRVLQKHGLTRGEYLLFSGGPQPHKNHQAAFQALRVLREAYGLRPVLVCTGSPRTAHGDLLGKIEDAELGDRVRFLGPCPASDMPGLYEGAAALVFPSFFEGFGLALLEAMWCECPIVCSSTTSLPEIAGDAALLVDPRSPEALAHALNRVLTDQELRSGLVARGRQRVRDFSWTRFTLEVVSVLRRAGQLRYEWSPAVENGPRVHGGIGVTENGIRGATWRAGARAASPAADP